jgi:hypothetical protein
MLNNVRGEHAMTGSDEERAVDEREIGVGEASVRADSGGVRRDSIIWAWATGAGHYDWMDHAPLFHHRD